MATTPDYVARAHKNYINKFDKATLMLPKGSLEIIREVTGESVNAYVNRIVAEDMMRTYGIDITEK